MVIKLLFIVVGMFIFVVGVLLSMYDVICDFIGLNGKILNEVVDVKDVVV